jgi:hypothetical protein
MIPDISPIQELDFPNGGKIVFVLHYSLQDGIEPLPFYVGESSRHVGRFADYVAADFSAPSDFKVGEAVSFLRSKGLRVIIRFWESADSKAEERRILRDLRGTFRLLNDLKGYRYGHGDEEGERRKVRRFIDEILENPYSVGRNARAKAPAANGLQGADTGETATAGASLSNHDMIAAAVRDFGGKTLATSDIKTIVYRAFPNFSPGSLLPNVHAVGNKSGCWCAGTENRIFDRVEPGRYLVRGPADRS